MPYETESGAIYRRNLPHIWVPGKIYHVRFSVHPDVGNLRRDEHFELVQYAIMFGHKKTHVLYAHVVMSNHSHVVLQPLPKVQDWSAWCDYSKFHHLEEIIRNIKSFSARFINRMVGRTGSVWLSEYFDRIIRNREDLDSVIDYVHNNPVRWDLVEQPEQYRWSSASNIHSGRDEYRDWFVMEGERA